jgi:hypothetical protein
MDANGYFSAALSIQHSAIRGKHSALSIQHSALSIQHSAIRSVVDRAVLLGKIAERVNLSEHRRLLLALIEGRYAAGIASDFVVEMPSRPHVVLVDKGSLDCVRQRLSRLGMTEFGGSGSSWRTFLSAEC